MAEKEAYVERFLLMCGLEKYADAIVGSLGIEQRRKLAIAVELATEPKLLLFLDKPTSGLDSQSAWAIMSFWLIMDRPFTARTSLFVIFLICVLELNSRLEFISPLLDYSKSAIGCCC